MSADKHVTLTIDGQEVTVPAGTLIIRAAEAMGKFIPRFCDHPLLDPLGACRQCLVEVEGQRKPLTACTTPVADGMVVMTQTTSELAREGQDGVLEFLLLNHPLDCPMCDKGGECPLQDQALSYGPGGSRYIDPKRRFVKPVPISPLVKLDRERCVLCARCTRFADQISGDPFIELFERGALEQVAIFEDEPYQSIFSGNVVQICPVGALTSSTFRFLARPFDMTSAEGTCNRCASGCRITTQTRRGQITRILARDDRDVNDAWLCDKGRFAWEYTRSPQRVTEPLVRKGGDFVPVSWAEALALVADQIDAARTSGKRAAVIGGHQLLDEDAYALSRFARTVLGTNDIDAMWNGGGTVLRALPRAATATNQDIDAAKAIVIVGTDLHEESPIVFLRVRKAARKGTRVIEIGPRRSTSKVARARWTPCKPGEEADALRELAGSLADVQGSVVVLAGDRLDDASLAEAWNLSIQVGGRFGWVPRKAGARGALWAGVHPGLLPAGRSVDERHDREAVGEVWGSEIPATPGRDARALLDGGDLGLVYLAGADPVSEAGDPDALARAIEGADFVVAQDMFLTETTKLADVVLPVAAVYERDGTLSNWEGRVQPCTAAVPPPGLAQSDYEILAQIAAGAGVTFPQTLEGLRKEMATLSADLIEPQRVEVPARAQPQGGLVLATYKALLSEGTMMAGADALLQTADPEDIEINPADAGSLRTGDAVVVSTARGDVQGTVRITDSVAAGVVFVPGAAAGPGSGARVEKI